MSITTSKYSSEAEVENRRNFESLFKDSPIPQNELMRNLGLYINRVGLTRILFMYDMYSKILNTQGVVMEFGCRWGQNLSLFINMRGILEPFNMARKIIGFDTFEGLKGIDPNDKVTSQGEKHANSGDYSVTDNYNHHLESVLDYHASESPASQIKRHEVRRGDASLEIVKYLKDRPETIIAFAYFDMDIYKPTLDCLKAIKPHLTKGSIIGLDELVSKDFPGETLAFQEVFGSNNFRLVNSPFSSGSTYLVFE